MAPIRASKAQVDLEMRLLDQQRDIIRRLLLIDKLPVSEIARRVGRKETRLTRWMELNGLKANQAENN